ncbi:non-ribosomal peptide synthetase [Actinosynnema pretiosum]|uniref:Carrier domain-containing protein n=1 Tax=Actinosynnema pretiosum TaxID=42197 RepID=A0A290Z9N7_9PSEU|nr:AMP-binding protein [Actinosynnema pretiosum]ATE55704.1 hypothetical protein CNX65_22435 [Actinosynnema pretiosum]
MSAGPVSGVPGGVPAALARIAEATPDAPALLDRDRALSFRELLSELDRVAGGLAVGRGALVAVLAERHWTTVAGALGVLRAGGAYLPLSPGDPPERLREAVAEAGAVAVLGRGAARVDLGAPFLAYEELRGTARATTGPEDLAYLLRTSGSTGRPKGVLVPHRAVLAAGTALSARYGITPADRVLNLTPLIWDTAGEEIYATLFGGAAVVTDSRTERASARTLLDVMAERGVTVVNLATALWAELADHVLTTGERLPASLRLVVIGGEEARARTVRRWCEHVDAELINAYGQTETVMVTHAADLGGAVGRALADDDVVPIGRALPHIREVLVPAGEGVFELRVGGPSVAWGYRGAPALTADRFPPCDGDRLYRTGDLVRVGAAGLEFVGRADRQVKVRGVRVEPAEVERAVVSCAGVAAAAVFAVGGEHRSLVAVYVPSARDAATPEGVREALRAKLPESLRPHHVHARAELPLTATGKVDVGALRELYSGPEAGAGPGSGSGSGAGPGAEPEPGGASLLEVVTSVYREVLAADATGDSSYFDLGGDSLLAIRLISRLTARTTTRLTVREVFEHPTPRALAAHLGRAV